MLGILLIFLLFLWFLGYVRIEGLTIPDIHLFQINGQSITLWKILIFLIILWAIEALPSPLRQIAMVILLLWILATIGVIVIANLSSLLILALIIGVVLSLVQK